MAREIDYTVLSDRDCMRAQHAAMLLHPHQHVQGCPVRAGASASCVFPAVCCVFNEWQPVDMPATGGGWSSLAGYSSVEEWRASDEAQLWLRKVGSL